jgi:small-conductance mechanosensitive channel
MANTAAHSSQIEKPFQFFDVPIQWLTTNWPQVLIALAVGLVIYFVLEGLRWLALSITKRLASLRPGSFFTVLRGVAGKTSHLFLALVATRMVVAYADPPAQLFQTINFLFIFGAVYQGARWLRAFIFGFVDLHSDLENGGNEALANASGLIRALVTGILLVVSTVVILDNLGVNVTGLVAGLGIGGIAIGLAAQGIFSDLFASLSIIFDRPFRVGEIIDFGTGPARVERIGLKSTRLRALTGEKLIVSNSQLLNKEITSFAELDHRRYSYRVGFVYQTSPEAALAAPEAMREVIEAEGAHFVRAGFVAFGPSSLDFDLQFEISASEDVDVQRHRIGIALFKRFNELGLELAYPTQTSFTAAPDGTLVMPYAPHS